MRPGGRETAAGGETTGLDVFAPLWLRPPGAVAARGGARRRGGGECAPRGGSSVAVGWRAACACQDRQRTRSGALEKGSGYPAAQGPRPAPSRARFGRGHLPSPPPHFCGRRRTAAATSSQSSQPPRRARAGVGGTEEGRVLQLRRPVAAGAGHAQLERRVRADEAGDPGLGGSWSERSCSAGR